MAGPGCGEAAPDPGFSMTRKSQGRHSAYAEPVPVISEHETGPRPDFLKRIRGCRRRDPDRTGVPLPRGLPAESAIIRWRGSANRLSSGSMSSSTTPQTSAIETLRQYYQAFNAGDRAAFLALLTDDIAHDVNQGGRETGKDTFAAFLDRMDRCYREQIDDLVLWADESGTRGAAEFLVRGTYLATDEGLPDATGQTYTLPAGAFFTLRGGRVERVTMYYNLTEWLRQIAEAGQDGA